MRDVKFRGLSEALGYMVKGSYLYEPKVIERTIYEHWIVRDDGFKYAIRLKNAHTIGQYTGRKDKNGVEIYEGDVVEENENLAVCTWFIEAGAYAFVPVELYPCELKKLIAYHSYDTFFENDVPEIFVKVIGNIYENPELLGVSQNE